MTRNPFIGAPRNSILGQSHVRWRIPEAAAEAQEDHAQDRLPMDPLPQHHAVQFFKFIRTLTLIFLIAAAFVFREIQHYDERYRLGRQLATAETQTRQWQERQRLEEAREAALLAELHSQQFATGNSQRIKVTYNFPNRGRQPLQGQR
jgi:hypothetical protein